MSEKKSSDPMFDSIGAMLHKTHPRLDPDTIEGNLRRAFPNSKALLNSTAYSLECQGVHPHDALLISNLLNLKRIALSNRYVEHPQLGRLTLAAQFMRDHCYALKVERFYVICLDVRGRKKACLLIQEGTEDGTLFNLHKILCEVSRLQPCAIVFFHNHPGGTLVPSQDDINCTLIAMDALSGLRVPLLDHVIVAGEHAVSMRENGFIPASVWLKQAPKNRLNLNWLNEEPLPNVANFRTRKKETN